MVKILDLKEMVRRYGSAGESLLAFYQYVPVDPEVKELYRDEELKLFDDFWECTKKSGERLQYVPLYEEAFGGEMCNWWENGKLPEENISLHDFLLQYISVAENGREMMRGWLKNSSFLWEYDKYLKIPLKETPVGLYAEDVYGIVDDLLKIIGTSKLIEAYNFPFYTVYLSSKIRPRYTFRGKGLRGEALMLTKGFEVITMPVESSRAGIRYENGRPVWYAGHYMYEEFPPGEYFQIAGKYFLKIKESV